MHIDASPTEYITGEIVIEGYTAVQEVLLAFRSNESECINVTIYGDAGIFEFQITPSDIGIGDYQLFVVAHGFDGQYEEQELGTLSILPPFSYLAAIAAAFTVFVIQGICAKFWGLSSKSVITRGKRISVVDVRDGLALRK